jgi:hypothetical protein
MMTAGQQGLFYKIYDERFLLESLEKIEKTAQRRPVLEFIVKFFFSEI